MCSLPTDDTELEPGMWLSGRWGAGGSCTSGRVCVRSAVDANGNTFAEMCTPTPCPRLSLSLLKAGVWLEGPARMGLSLSVQQEVPQTSSYPLTARY